MTNAVVGYIASGFVATVGWALVALAGGPVWASSMTFFLAYLIVNDGIRVRK
jgi:hypothetical protein